MNSFDSYPLLPSIQESLNSLGFTQATEIQGKILPELLKNYKRDVHAQAQTGTGKTLAFGLPLLHAVDPSVGQVQGLVMAPTRELVLQIYESLKEVSRGSNISIEPIYGGMPIGKQTAALKKGVQIVVGTPGRINDHLRRKSLKLKNLKVLVLDEADIMLDMGFRQEIDEILSHAPDNRSIWLFSATVMSGIKKLIKSHMKNVFSVKAEKSGQTSSQVSQYFCVAPQKKRLEATARFIESAPDFYGIIFCRTKNLSSEVTEELASKGFKVNCLHGDMKQSLRNHVIAGFKNKDFNILVATDVAARGIDVSNLSHVINYSIPDDFESYIHRIGRTGRAGKEGVAIMFVGPSEMKRLKRLEKATSAKLIEISVPPMEAVVNAKIGAVSDFIEQSKKDEKKQDAVDEALSKMIDSFTHEEVKGALESLLKEKFFTGVNEKEVKVESSTIPQEICMELGREHGVDEDEVRSYLFTVCELAPHEISKVRVIRGKTFISIPENRLNKCLELMRSNPFSKKKAKVYLVEDDFKPFKKPAKRKSFKGKKLTVRKEKRRRKR